MNELTFVDTNVLVYARDSRHAQKQRIAAEYLKALWLDRAGRTSVQVLSEFYVTVTRRLRPGLTPEDAWDETQMFMAWEPQAIDGEVLGSAREIERRYKISWWDAVVVAAAQMQGCAILLSEDLQHGTAFGALIVRNPFASDVHEADEQYPVRSTALRPLHRSRGRPARQAAKSG
jgi:predicted nucleic acid-binding protein